MGTLSNPTAGSGSGLGSNSGMSFNSNAGFGATSLAPSNSNFGANSNSVASLVDLTRGGWSNTAGQQRGTLQRVSYALVDDVLKRSYQTSPGHRVGQPAHRAGSLYRGESHSTALPRQQSSMADPVAARHCDARWPMAETGGRELIIEFKDWGVVRRLIEVADEAARHPAGQLSRRGSMPRRQRGVALIIALILVSLATVLASKLTYDGSSRTQALPWGCSPRSRPFQFGLGRRGAGRGCAARRLSEQRQSHHADGSLAQATQPLPITPQDDPEGEPIGTLEGSLEDMQGRFNLNNLARVTTDGKQDPQPLEQFQRLLVAVGLEAKWAGLARDWIDVDDQPGSPDGAEDSIYTSQTPPYRTGNWPMMSASELMNLPGFGADRYRMIAPYVTALPLRHRPINICTASAPVLESLDETLSGEYSARSWRMAARPVVSRSSRRSKTFWGRSSRRP